MKTTTRTIEKTRIIKITIIMMMNDNDLSINPSLLLLSLRQQTFLSFE